MQNSNESKQSSDGNPTRARYISNHKTTPKTTTDRNMIELIGCTSENSKFFSFRFTETLFPLQICILCRLLVTFLSTEVRMLGMGHVVAEMFKKKI